jgi:hypothetical protein
VGEWRREQAKIILELEQVHTYNVYRVRPAAATGQRGAYTAVALSSAIKQHTSTALAVCLYHVSWSVPGAFVGAALERAVSLPTALATRAKGGGQGGRGGRGRRMARQSQGQQAQLSTLMHT